ncbi:hypothetical protein ACQ4LE_003591 [Meloidogyne hapla]|uniref:Pept_C1 domain-containing protein n=1 Tax=Meloidogyne hapla TaxID=6305 RepID=A0A1I8AY14_MELHA
MKKIIIIFSILLLLNISSKSSLVSADPLLDLLNSILGGILGLLVPLLKSLLGGILNLSPNEYTDLAKDLRLLASMGIKISAKELQERAAEIAQINLLNDGDWTAKLGFNFLLPEEFRQKRRGALMADLAADAVEDKPREKRVARAKRETCTYKTEFDVRDKWPGCRPIISYVQDQAFCGCCWAVSTASCYTDRYCIDRAKKGLSTPNDANNIFSAFDILSCAKPNGCEGDYPYTAWEWIRKYGVSTGTDYPRRNGCKPYPFSPTEKNPTTKPCTQSCTNRGWRIPYNNDRKHYISKFDNIKGEQAIKNELQRNGPVVARFYYYEDLGAHRDGIYRHVWGAGGKDGHAFVIVGYGIRTCGNVKLPYWIIRNSWGTNFGEGGFFKFLRGKNECGIEDYISYGIPKV